MKTRHQSECEKIWPSLGTMTASPDFLHSVSRQFSPYKTAKTGLYTDCIHARSPDIAFSLGYLQNSRYPKRGLPKCLIDVQLKMDQL